MKTIEVAVLLGDKGLEDRVKHGGRFQPEDLKVIRTMKRALAMIPGHRFQYFGNHSTILRDIAGFPGRVDYAINFCDEGLYNDPEREADITDALEENRVLFTGAGSECLRFCYNKSEVKKKAFGLDVPVTRGIVLSGNDLVTMPPFDFPAFIKPVFGDGSFGIVKENIVHTRQDYTRQVAWLRGVLSSANARNDILVEEYLPGNEFTVAIIGNPFYLETRVLEEDLEDEGMISQRVKWDPDHFKGTHSKYPEFSLEAQETAVIHSLRMFREFGCRDYARIDWRLDRFGKPKLMEVNPNCGVSDDSHLSIAYMLGEEQSVMCYASNVLYKILRAAEMRFSRMKYEKK